MHFIRHSTDKKEEGRGWRPERFFVGGVDRGSSRQAQDRLNAGAQSNCVVIILCYQLCCENVERTEPRAGVSGGGGGGDEAEREGGGGGGRRRATAGGIHAHA